MAQERLAKMQPIAQKKYIKKVLRKQFSEKMCKLLSNVGKKEGTAEDETPAAVQLQESARSLEPSVELQDQLKKAMGRKFGGKLTVAASPFSQAPKFGKKGTPKGLSRGMATPSKSPGSGGLKRGTS